MTVELPQIDRTRFRSVLGHYPTDVVVVTATDDTSKLIGTASVRSRPCRRTRRWSPSFRARHPRRSDTSVIDILTRGTEQLVNTSSFDVTGHPACSVPAGLFDGFPVGMMIPGRQFGEAIALRSARAMEIEMRGLSAPAWIQGGLMNGVFDLGGTDGFGPIGATPSEPVFHAEWEKVVFALQLGSFPAGWFTIDSFRHGIELMDPVHYLTSSYFEHWLSTIEHHGVIKGHLDPDELDRRTAEYLKDPNKPMPDHALKPELIALVDGAVSIGSPADRPTDATERFQVGDRVRMRSVAPRGHTRLARYVRGKCGTVVAHRGSFVYPDTAGNERGENPQHLYTVQFEGIELWGEGNSEPHTSSTFDAWDPYLEPMNHQEGVSV